LTQIVQEADARTADAVVDHFILRFLPTFSPDDIDRQRLVDFLTSQTGGQMIDVGSGDTLEETLRQVVHLIMSMPEYNVS
ncbi:MAG: hypothetical protein QF681_11250, partial [Vicinamibacterales bacterium]|nr:hypothetical protein [Vicinamibacterales bacterium]